MKTEASDLAISRVFEAPRQLVYRAFTEPDHLAQWWGPIGNTLLRDDIDLDVRPGGYQRWTEVSDKNPNVRVQIFIELTDVRDGELLAGVMHVNGQLQDGVQPFETRLRVEFHDEGEGRTRLEIRQWLPPHLTGPTEQGWLQAFTKLDAALTSAQQLADREGDAA